MGKSDMVWDLGELNELCSNRGRPSPKIFSQSLCHQRRRVHYHAEESLRIIERYMKYYGPNINLNNSKHMTALGRAEFKSTCHAEACVQTAYAMADIFSQIANISLLSNPLDLENVTFDRVRAAFAKEAETIGFSKLLDLLKESKEFSYIEAFVNTIKHRNLLTFNFRAEGGINTRNDYGLIVRDFDFRGKHFETTWVKDILNIYCGFLLEEYARLGSEINKLMRS